MNHYFSGTEPTPAYRAACGNHRDISGMLDRVDDQEICECCDASLETLHESS